MVDDHNEGWLKGRVVRHCSAEREVRLRAVHRTNHLPHEVAALCLAALRSEGEEGGDDGDGGDGDGDGDGGALAEGNMAVAEQRALGTMSAYRCGECHQLFVGGRVECAAAAAAAPASRAPGAPRARPRCRACVWSAPGNSYRCDVHGASFAVFKCDSCCSLATFHCTTNYYCNRCHGMAHQPKHFPCPGPDACPLGKPHPPNQPAVHMGGQDRGGGATEPSGFVVGCSKCFEQPSS